MVTNNGVEGYNSRLRSIIGKKKQPLGGWIKIIGREIDD